jgi:lysozyme family protein
MSNFERAFAFTVGNEGGYVNNPNDIGGPTKYGITISTLSSWLNRKASADDVKNMPLSTAHVIYETRYWKPVGCDRIESPEIAICMFDFCVLRGAYIPSLYAQTICNHFGGSLVTDGKIGPKSIEAINCLSPKEFIPDFSAMAEEGFREIVRNNPSQQVFLQGWINRAHRLLTLIN